MLKTYEKGIDVSQCNDITNIPPSTKKKKISYGVG
jgi:hypothetical protein